MTKRAKFSVRRCHGSFVEFVEVDIPAEYNDCSGDDLRYEYGCEVLSAAGITNYTCDGCYDQAYHVEFVEWVKSNDYVGDYVI